MIRDGLRGEFGPSEDELGANLAGLFSERHGEIARLLGRAQELGLRIQQSIRLPFVLCHGDLHLANVMLDSRDNLFVIDWDQPVLAPMERDLLFVAGSARESVFLDGYGAAAVDPTVIAYYRYEWAVQEIGDYAERIVGRPDLDDETRRMALVGLRSVFEPGGDAETAYRAGAGLRLSS